MDSFTSKLAVVIGGGSGMGRELAAQGCSVAACDWHPDAVAETAALAQADAGSGVLVTSHACDVSDEAQVLRFRDELLGQHAGPDQPGPHAGRDHPLQLGVAQALGFPPVGAQGIRDDVGAHVSR